MSTRLAAKGARQQFEEGVEAHEHISVTDNDKTLILDDFGGNRN